MTKNEEPEVRRIIQDLRAAYIPNHAYRKLEGCFRKELAQRRADLADGVVSKPRSIALIGASGSGKTTAIKHLIRNNSDRLQTDPAQETCEWISLQIPSPATMKSVGNTVLQAAGYPLNRDKPASTIWDMARQQLMYRQTLFVHLDEAQDLTRFQTENERRSVVNTLKSMMENSRWPVGLILSGTPELTEIINQDPQLSRRLYPIEIDRLDEHRDTGAVIDLIKRYAARARVGYEDGLAQENFAQRLIHAADSEFGLLAELVVQSISEALLSGGLGVTLRQSHFADVFHLRSAAVDGLNPFLATDFRRIDPRQVLDDGSRMMPPRPRGTR